MSDFAPELKRLLREAGCYFVRSGKGDHEIWFSPMVGRNVTVDSKIKSRHTANAVLKQSGLEKKLLIETIPTAVRARGRFAWPFQRVTTRRVGRAATARVFGACDFKPFQPGWILMANSR